MNTDLFAQLPNWVNFIAFPVLSWIALAVVRFLLHKYRKVLRIEDVDYDVVDSATQNIMSGAYVVMGFVLVLVMATASDVDGNVAKEASQIVSLDGMLGMDASSAARSAQGALREYASSVVNDEWKCLRQGTGSEVTGASQAKLLKALASLEPASRRQVALYSEIIRKGDEIAQARDVRIENSQSRLPALFWQVSFLSLFGVIVNGALRLMEPTSVRIIAIGTQIGMISLLFTAVMILDLPHLGATKTSPEPIVKAIKIMTQRAAISK
jgi:hypothetical protein